jgi:hypothetical protein
MRRRFFCMVWSLQHFVHATFFLQRFVLATFCPCNILSATICPQHFVRDDMSATFCLATFCPATFCPCDILSATFCPRHFVWRHFVLAPFRGPCARTPYNYFSSKTFSWTLIWFLCIIIRRRWPIRQKKDLLEKHTYLSSKKQRKTTSWTSSDPQSASKG